MDLPELDALLTVLRKHGVEAFDGCEIKLRLRPYAPSEPEVIRPEPQERD